MENSVVKSVGRAFHVLELFQKQREPLSATYICRHLDLPNSSANVLLKSLVELGYLSLDARSKNYFPTLALSKLGEWVSSVFFGNNDILHLLEDLQSSTHETVSLSMSNGLKMQFISVLPSNFPISLNLREGLTVSLFDTGVGLAQLSSRPDEEIAILVKQANRRAGSAKKIQLAKLMERVSETRADGFAKAYDSTVSDTGALAMPLPESIYKPCLVIAVGGLWERIKSNEEKIVRSMQRTLRDFQ